MIVEENKDDISLIQLINSSLNKSKDDISLIQLVNSLNIPNEFDFEKIDKVIEESSYFNDSIKINYGATKVVIYKENSSFVIKIPFNGYRYGNKGKWIPFVGNKKYKKMWNYCEEEIYIYNLFEKNKISNFFVKSIKAGVTKNNYPYYIQKKVIPYSDIKNQSRVIPFDSYPIAQEIAKKYFPIMSTSFLSYLVEFYGQKACYKLYSCLFNNFHEIRDLHDSNVGFINKNIPIIFDYGGFHEFY